eukprot:14361446-Heterocapsa_arctica.AAC.1
MRSTSSTSTRNYVDFENLMKLEPEDCFSLALAICALRKRELGHYEMMDATGIYDNNFDFQSMDDMLNYQAATVVEKCVGER